ncbi:hypothetical protein JOM56_008355 [Amanita muscaria]|uniref:Uncharacterized protein n=1 Tax=Amanita muscaria (strain Koide BX008) TaxID=946122 RepID=A0A0C2X245_AMAMK|nr:hypothetical protein M378DRAFT_158757 [Amanita muscaria Koide BX008]
MLAILLMALSAATALVFVHLFLPVLWRSLVVVDETLDAHEAGLALVASRNPFRETGPPANMAKLILLRHKIQTGNRKRRSSSHVRQPPRPYNISTTRPKTPWVRFGKSFGGMQFH